MSNKIIIELKCMVVVGVCQLNTQQPTKKGFTMVESMNGRFGERDAWGKLVE